MKNLFSILAVLFGAISFQSNSAIGQCASESNIYAFTYAGIQYEIVKENLSWDDAAACAVERGGYLARVDSAAEQDAIFSAANLDAGITLSSTVAPDGGGGSYMWLGGTDKLTEGEWLWDGTDAGAGDQFWQGTSAATGGTVVGALYNKWGDEPDDFGSGQDGLAMALTDWPLGVLSEWNDVASSNTIYYIIEYPDQTSIDETNKTEIKLYPNPIEDQLKISVPENLV